MYERVSRAVDRLSGSVERIPQLSNGQVSFGVMEHMCTCSHFDATVGRGLMERANWEDLGFQEGAEQAGTKPQAKHTQGPSPGIDRRV